MAYVPFCLETCYSTYPQQGVWRGRKGWLNRARALALLVKREDWTAARAMADEVLEAAEGSSPYCAFARKLALLLLQRKFIEANAIA